MKLSIPCPRCKTVGIEITKDESGPMPRYLVACSNQECGTRVTVPFHPVVEYVMLAGEDTLVALKSYRILYEVIKLAFGRKDD